MNYKNVAKKKKKNTAMIVIASIKSVVKSKKITTQWVVNKNVDYHFCGEFADKSQLSCRATLLKSI